MALGISCIQSLESYQLDDLPADRSLAGCDASKGTTPTVQRPKSNRDYEFSQLGLQGCAPQEPRPNLNSYAYQCYAVSRYLVDFEIGCFREPHARIFVELEAPTEISADVSDFRTDLASGRFH